MTDLPVPPNMMPYDEWVMWLREIAERDMPAARQAALLRLIWEEPGLIQEGLIARVEYLLGRRCFGSTPEAAFERDVAAVREALAGAGHRLLQRDDAGRRRYHVEGRPHLDEHLRQLIAGAAAEVDPRQIAIYRRLEPAQRVWQLAHLSDWLRQSNERRLIRSEVS